MFDGAMKESKETLKNAGIERRTSSRPKPSKGNATKIVV
jgi:hypothetical protein